MNMYQYIDTQLPRVWTQRVLLLTLLCALIQPPPLHASSSLARRMAKGPKADGRQYVYLADIAAYYGFTSATRDAKRMVMKSAWTEMVVHFDSRRIVLNGSTVWLNVPTRKLKRKWAVAHDDFLKTLDPLLRPHKHLAGLGHRVVVIDPGHGGEDSGTSGAHSEEKKLVLELALKLKKRLTAMGYVVHLTRSDDHFIELSNRPAIAAKHKADLLLSLHFNSGSDTNTVGAESFLLSLPGYASTNDNSGGTPDKKAHPGNRHDTANLYLSHCIQQRLIKDIKSKDRGVKRARFLVLKKATCPAVLIEAGFLSNQGEEAKIRSAAHQERLAAALALGVTNYFNQVKKANLAVATATPAAKADTSTRTKQL